MVDASSFMIACGAASKNSRLLGQVEVKEGSIPVHQAEHIFGGGDNAEFVALVDLAIWRVLTNSTNVQDHRDALFEHMLLHDAFPYEATT